MERAADPVFALADRFVESFAKQSPVQATYGGVTGFHDGWDDYSPEGADALAGFFASALSDVRALPSATDLWGEVARKVFEEYLTERASFFEHEEHIADLNNIESPVQHVRTVFDLMDTSSREGLEAIARRLEGVERVLGSYRTTLMRGRATNHTAAARQVRTVIEQLGIHSSRASLAELLDAPKRAGIEDAALTRALERGLDSARAAFGRMGSWLEAEYLPHARANDAVGREPYTRAARRFLGADVDLEETYRWGWSEITKTEAAMREVARTIDPNATVPAVIEALRSSDAYVANGMDALLEFVRGIQEGALRDLHGKHFDVPEPVRAIEVKAAPRGTALGAYYIPPSDGFTRPGSIYYVRGDSDRFPLFEEVTTAYHEGFPGHHLQCSLQVHFADRLTRFHRLFGLWSGYAEGWALYAESLMHELGYMTRPEDVLGMHLAKLFRACRVVVDIGAHLELPIPKTAPFRPGERFTHDTMVEFLVKHGLMRPALARSETVRYLGWPGQAISYKVGERFLLQLREDARRALGSRFDLCSFHGAVLSSGSVGLELCREVVERELSLRTA